MRSPTLMQERPLNIKLILKGCQEGNPQAQQKLYKHFYGYALSTCLRFAKNREEAVEVMNDGFLKIFNNLDKYDDDFPFKTWIRRIFINSNIDYHRKYHKNPPSLLLETAETLPDDAVADFELSPEINVLPILQKLSPAYRMVFNLYVMEEYKHHEIAEKLGISVSTSKTNLARAKQKLRELLEKKTIVDQSNGQRLNIKEHG